MFDASSLLGGMLGSGFGRRREPSSSGVLGTVATVGGLAAVGGLGYMAYRHFAGGQQAAAPGWAGPPGGAMPPGAPQGAGGGGAWGGGPPPAPGTPWGAAPGAAPAAAGGGVGSFVKGLVGASDGLQTQGFGAVPGYEYQSGGGAPAAPMGPPSWATNPNAPIAQAPALAAASPAQAYGPPPAAAGAPPGAPSGYVPPPPPPIFDASGAVTGAASPPAQAPAAPPAPPAELADPAAQKGALLLVWAMVAAAAADGSIDATERADILGRLAATGVGAAEQAELAKELDQPRPVASLVAEVEGPEMARQFYAVSLLAIHVDSAAEKLHMRALAGMLGLSADDVAKIHGELGVPALA